MQTLTHCLATAQNQAMFSLPTADKTQRLLVLSDPDRRNSPPHRGCALITAEERAHHVNYMWTPCAGKAKNTLHAVLLKTVETEISGLLNVCLREIEGTLVSQFPCSNHSTSM